MPPPLPPTVSHRCGRTSLRSYQCEGVTWLLFNWFQHRSCVLADEMGLGKTAQSITFLHQLASRPECRVRGPFLVVAPLSTLPHWQREVDTWTGMNAITYHGSAAARRNIRQREFHWRGTDGTLQTKFYKFNGECWWVRLRVQCGCSVLTMCCALQC